MEHSRVLTIIAIVIAVGFGLLYFLTRNSLGYTGWNEAVEILNQGEVTKVVKDSNGNLSLEFEDGSFVLTTEPTDDTIEDQIIVCGGKCTGIEVTIQE